MPGLRFDDGMFYSLRFLKGHGKQRLQYIEAGSGFGDRTEKAPSSLSSRLSILLAKAEQF